jgi:hypothetical protein
MRSAIILLPFLALAACKDPPVVYVDRPIEVRMPVAAPCMGDRPAEVAALRDSIGREVWDALSTDQRANLLAAQALARKVFGEQASDASAGCK